MTDFEKWFEQRKLRPFAMDIIEDGISRQTYSIAKEAYEAGADAQRERDDDFLETVCGSKPYAEAIRNQDKEHAI